MRLEFFYSAIISITFLFVLYPQNISVEFTACAIAYCYWCLTHGFQLFSYDYDRTSASVYHANKVLLSVILDLKQKNKLSDNKLDFRKLEAIRTK